MDFVVISMKFHSEFDGNISTPSWTTFMKLKSKIRQTCLNFYGEMEAAK